MTSLREELKRAVTGEAEQPEPDAFESAQEVAATLNELIALYKMPDVLREARKSLRELMRGLDDGTVQLTIEDMAKVTENLERLDAALAVQTQALTEKH